MIKPKRRRTLRDEQRAGVIEREKKISRAIEEKRGEKFFRLVVGEDGCRIEVLGNLDSWEGGRDTWPRWLQVCIRKTCTSTTARINGRARYLQSLGWGKGSGSGLSGGLWRRGSRWNWADV